MVRKRNDSKLGALVALLVVGLSTVFVLAGCTEGATPADISIQDIATVEVGSGQSVPVDSLVVAYNQATASSFSTETTPTPLATLHLRGGGRIQLQFSDLFPRDCALVVVAPEEGWSGATYYKLKAPGLLSAVCEMGDIDRSEFEPSR